MCEAPASVEFKGGGTVPGCCVGGCAGQEGDGEFVEGLGFVD